MNEISSRFHRQVTYDEELHTYVFVDINSSVPGEGCMYIIFHGPTKRYFRYNLTIDQFNLTSAKDSDSTT